MLSNITALKTVKENTNKVVLDAMPGILFESANKGQNRQKFFPHGEEETILVVVDDSFARRLAYPLAHPCELTTILDVNYKIVP